MSDTEFANCTKKLKSLMVSAGLRVAAGMILMFAASSLPTNHQYRPLAMFLAGVSVMTTVLAVQYIYKALMLVMEFSQER